MTIALPGRTSTRRAGLLAAVGAGVILIAGFGVVDQGIAAGRKHSPTCSLATLNGRYMFADAGTILPHAFGVKVPTLAADAGFETFNGDGTGMDTVTLRVDGVIQFHDGAASTKYTLEPDCTGTIAVTVNGNPGPTFDIFVSPDGKAFSSIATDRGNYPSRIELRANSDD
jgi:hypothetical protein